MKATALALSLVLLLPGCTTARLASQTQGTTNEATIRLLEEQERLGVLNRDTAALLHMVQRRFSQLAMPRGRARRCSAASRTFGGKRQECGAW